jgi:nucleoid-associated protein YgaU
MIRLMGLYAVLLAFMGVGAVLLRPGVQQDVDIAATVAQPSERTAFARPAERPARAPVGLDSVSAVDIARIDAIDVPVIDVPAPVVFSAIDRAEPATPASATAHAADTDGSVDLEPLLDLPASVSSADGTRILAAGPTPPAEGPLTADEQALREAVSAIVSVSNAPEPPARPQFYTVQAGDSLGSIAAQMYGDRDAYIRIYEANSETLRSIDYVQVGQRLRLP